MNTAGASHKKKLAIQVLSEQIDHAAGSIVQQVFCYGLGSSVILFVGWYGTRLMYACLNVFYIKFNIFYGIMLIRTCSFAWLIPPTQYLVPYRYKLIYSTLSTM
jgi:hypothetical protein